ncbi:MAG: hypothetical protein K2Q20_04805 [Phycisphaerales bacterium]|nr:hypothetical protein [Phycisphaerales bacterium]
MSLFKRVDRLERDLRAKAAPATCPDCGGPCPGRSAYVVQGMDGRPKWGVCPRCGLALDHTGRASPAWPWTPGMGMGIKVYGCQTPVEDV